MTIALSATVVAATGLNPLMVGAATGTVIAGMGKMIASGAGPAAATVAVSSSTGAILAALASKSFAGSIGAGVSGAATSIMTNWICSLAIGPLGGVIVGTSLQTDNVHNRCAYTFDCWKQVLREENSTVSNGMILRDVLTDDRVRKVVLSTLESSPLPQITVENIWDDKFLIEFMFLPDLELVSAHAKQY